MLAIRSKCRLCQSFSDKIDRNKFADLRTKQTMCASPACNPACTPNVLANCVQVPCSLSLYLESYKARDGGHPTLLRAVTYSGSLVYSSLHDT